MTGLLRRRKKTEPTKKKRTLVAPKHKPLPKRMVGKRDPRHPEALLVPATKAPDHPMFPKLDPEMNFMDQTFYRWNVKEKVVTSLVTITPLGTSLAWWSCRVCKHGSPYLCECKRGMSVCRSVECITDQDQALADGEEWGIHHRNYYGSLGKKRRRENASNGGIVSVQQIRSEQGKEGNSSGFESIEYGATKRNKPAPKLLTRRKHKVDVETIDMATINAAAVTQASSDMEDVTGKLLRRKKKVEPATRPLIRRKNK